MAIMRRVKSVDAYAKIGENLRVFKMMKISKNKLKFKPVFIEFYSQKVKKLFSFKILKIQKF
jgi:hypothetical protein